MKALSLSNMKALSKPVRTFSQSNQWNDNFASSTRFVAEILGAGIFLPSAVPSGASASQQYAVDRHGPLPNVHSGEHPHRARLPSG
jgi:hypothetical protein